MLLLMVVLLVVLLAVVMCYLVLHPRRLGLRRGSATQRPRAAASLLGYIDDRWNRPTSDIFYGNPTKNADADAGVVVVVVGSLVLHPTALGFASGGRNAAAWPWGPLPLLLCVFVSRRSGLVGELTQSPVVIVMSVSSVIVMPMSRPTVSHPATFYWEEPPSPPHSPAHNLHPPRTTPISSFRHASPRCRLFRRRRR